MTNEVEENFLSDTIGPGYVIADRYVIDRELGTGGMGSVYLATDRLLGEEKVAVKVLHGEFVHEQKYTQRFLREVQLMRKLNHKNVVRTFDVGADKDLVYFTMEFVPGLSLADLINRRAVPKERLSQMIIEICEGLEAVHSANIIHRDLKPGNIIVTDSGSIKITDFGVARPERSNLTAHNEIIGSATYMAPEIWLGTEITASVDLYSLGIILYELVVGYAPYDADSPGMLMRMHLDRAPEPPKKVVSGLPLWLNKLILNLLEKSPADRPKNARDIIEYVKSSGLRESEENFDVGAQSTEKTPVVSDSFISTLEALSVQATGGTVNGDLKQPTVTGNLERGNAEKGAVTKSINPASASESNQGSFWARLWKKG